MGRNGYDPSVDAFDIHGAQALFEELKTFLFTPVTLEACRWCVGYVGKAEAHHQIDKELVANPALEPRTRRSHLDLQLFVRESVKYYGRRAAERLTGKPRW
jgi:hypothetical protein